MPGYKWIGFVRSCGTRSPEQIHGRLPKVYPNDLRMRVSPETIYAFIYAPEQADEKFWEYLPRKQKKRRKRPGRKVHRSRIPDRVSIRERPGFSIKIMRSACSVSVLNACSSYILDLRRKLSIITPVGQLK